MDKGEVKEFGETNQLLKNTDSLFYKIIKEI